MFSWKSQPPRCHPERSAAESRDLENCQARPAWLPIPEIPRLRSAALLMTHLSSLGCPARSCPQITQINADHSTNSSALICVIRGQPLAGEEDVMPTSQRDSPVTVLGMTGRLVRIPYRVWLESKNDGPQNAGCNTLIFRPTHFSTQKGQPTCRRNNPTCS